MIVLILAMRQVLHSQVRFEPPMRMAAINTILHKSLEPPRPSNCGFRNRTTKHVTPTYCTNYRNGCKMLQPESKKMPRNPTFKSILGTSFFVACYFSLYIYAGPVLEGLLWSVEVPPEMDESESSPIPRISMWVSCLHDSLG